MIIPPPAEWRMGDASNSILITAVSPNFARKDVDAMLFRISSANDAMQTQAKIKSQKQIKSNQVKSINQSIQMQRKSNQLEYIISEKRPISVTTNEYVM